MQTDIQARNFPLTEALENHVRTRIGFTLSRVAGRIQRVNIRLSDLNGPRGGIDMRCLIEVRLNRLPVVVVEDIQSNMYTAIDRASARAARTTIRRLGLERNRRRQEAAQMMRQLSTDIG